MSLELAEKAVLAAESLLKESPLLEEIAPIAQRLIGATAGRAEVASELIVGPRNASSYLEAREFLSKASSGGSGSFFVKASDGHSYLTKSLGNPQGDIILSHQYLAANVCDYMRLNAPRTAIIDIPEDFIQAHRSMLPIGIRPGPGIGAVDLGRDALSMLPKDGIAQIHNLHHFGTDMVMNISLSNFDGPQAMFTKANGGYMAHFTDWGMAFQPYDIFFQPSSSMANFYKPLTREVIEADIGRMVNMPDSVLSEPLKAMPDVWKANGLDSIISKGINSALQRAQRLPQLVQQSLQTSREWFPLVGEQPFRKWW